VILVEVCVSKGRITTKLITQFCIIDSVGFIILYATIIKIPPTLIGAKILKL